MAKITKLQLKKLSVLELIELLINVSFKSNTFLTEDNIPYAKEIAKRMDITPLQASLLGAFVDQCDDNRIRVRDIAIFYNVRTVSVLAISSEIDTLVREGFIICHRDNDGSCNYRVPSSTIDSLKKNEHPVKETYDGKTPQTFMETVYDLLNIRENGNIDDDDLYDRFHEMMDLNPQLHIAQKLKSYDFDDPDLVLFLAISSKCIFDHDDHIIGSDIEDYFCRSDFRAHMHELSAGVHALQHTKLIENSCVDGQVETATWRLSEYAKNEVYPELNLKSAVNVRANMTHYEEIPAKQLYYTEHVARQVSQLRSLLEHERMSKVLKKLGDKGMRKGFSCIFYGTPGTGKTATVMELARTTQRDIMVVDIPSIRSKWVGETEKNIQALFDRYKNAVKNSEVAPILLFNEADAIFNKRSSGTNGVDKMENAMQNIILQNMEDLEGILIATTNLQTSMDPAFERRFLYKVEFDKPTPKERKHIWMSMLPDLSEEDAMKLAVRFDFSGGQIENIARKRIVSDILNDCDTLDLDSIIENCQNELLKKETTLNKIGF